MFTFVLGTKGIQDNVWIVSGSLQDLQDLKGLKDLKDFQRFWTFRIRKLFHTLIYCIMDCIVDCFLREWTSSITDDFSLRIVF